MGMKEPAWFEQVSPHLLRNRTIRIFLGQYAAKDLPEIVKLTLIYGWVRVGYAYMHGGRTNALGEGFAPEAIPRSLLTERSGTERSVICHAMQTLGMVWKMG